MCVCVCVLTVFMSHVPTGHSGKVDTPDQGEGDVSDVGDVRKGGFEVHGGKEETVE